jgi:uncharacterized protein (DUF433 family)
LNRQVARTYCFGEEINKSWSFTAAQEVDSSCSPPRSKGERVELGQYIVADPHICHGKLTFKGTRIMVWQILDELEHGMSPEQIVKAWAGRVSRAAISESIRLARGALLDANGRLAGSRNARLAA